MAGHGGGNRTREKLLEERAKSWGGGAGAGAAGGGKGRGDVSSKNNGIVGRGC